MFVVLLPDHHAHKQVIQFIQIVQIKINKEYMKKEFMEKCNLKLEQVEKEIRQSIYIFKLIDEKINKQFWCYFN